MCSVIVMVLCECDRGASYNIPPRDVYAGTRPRYILYLIFGVFNKNPAEDQRSPERPREAQKRPRGAQRGPKRPTEAQRRSEKPREGQSLEFRGLRRPEFRV